MKKKIFVVALAACLLILSVAGSSMAYFTDIEDATNVFTAGNVDITLTFNGSTVDGDDTNDNNNALEITNEKVYPGQVFERNATISNVGSEDAYVGAIITLTNTNGNLDDVITPSGEADKIPVAIRAFFTDLVTTGYTVKYVEITNGYEVYILKTDALAGKTDTVIDGAKLFSSIVIPTEWDNDQMKAFSGLTVNVKAYATQKAGFADAKTALTTAFANKGWSAFENATELPAAPTNP